MYEFTWYLVGLEYIHNYRRKYPTVPSMFIHFQRFFNIEEKYYFSNLFRINAIHYKFFSAPAVRSNDYDY